MSAPLLLDIVLFLKNASLVSDDGVDAFRDFTPEEPDSLVSLHEYAGTGVLHVDPATHRSVQVISRSLDADAARQKALNIFKAFQSNINSDGLINLTLDRWGQMYLRQTPYLLKRDENNRSYYAFNIGITTSIE